MIIRELHIHRFGILQEQDVQELSPGLNIFLGRNEAGKSTCLNFFRAMFFGYKRSGKNDALDYLSVSPGQAGPSGGRRQSGRDAGGGMLLQTAGGIAFKLTRRPGKHGGELSLTDAQGRPMPAEYLSGLLGGVTAELYDRVFSFDLEDVSSLSGMKDSQVSAALHGAAFGTGFRSPAEVLQELARKQSAIFSPAATAKLPSLNVLLRRLQEVRRKLAEQGSDVERHGALLEEKAALTAALLDGDAALSGLNLRLGRAQSLLDAWDNWQELRRLEHELKLSPHPGGKFAEDGKERLEALCAERSEKQAALAARVQELENLQSQLERDCPAPVLLSAWPALQSLQAQRVRLGRALEALPGLLAELEAMRAGQNGILASLGGGWSASGVVNFDRSIAVRDLVLRHRQKLDDCARARELLGRDRERLEREREQVALEEARLRAARGGSLRELVSAAVAGVPVGEDSGGLAPVCPESEADLQKERFPSGPVYGPEVRLRLEELWKKLERAGAGRQEAALLARSGAEELTAAGERLDSLRQKAAGLPGNAFDGLEPQRIAPALRELADFRRICAEIGRLAAEKAELEEDLARKKPSLLSPLPARSDNRRFIPALLSVLIAGLALYGPGFSFSAASSGLEFLSGHWPALCLGLFACWSALFWLSPRLASCGLLRRQPGALELQLARIDERLQALERELNRLGNAVLAWLPVGLRSVFPAEGAGAAVSAWFALQQRFEELETQLQDLQQTAPLRQMLVEQIKQAEFERERAAAALAVNQASLNGLESECRLSFAAWDEFLRPYDLDGDCSLATALQIYDRAALADRLDRQLRELASRWREAEEDAERSAREWEAWLEAAGFAPDLTPAVILDALALIEKYQERQIQLERTQKEAENCRAEIAAFRGALRNLPPEAELSAVLAADPATGLPLQSFCDCADTELPVVFDNLFRAAEAAMRREALLRERQKDLAALRGRLVEAETSLRQNGAALRELFEMAGLREPDALVPGQASEHAPGHALGQVPSQVPSQVSGQVSGQAEDQLPALAEEFRLRFGQYRRHEQLRLERERLALHLERYSTQAAARVASADGVNNLREQDGVRARLSAAQPLWSGSGEFFAALAEADHEELTALAAGLSEKLAEAIAAREASLSRLGEVGARLEELERGSGGTELKQEEAALREELDVLARRWGALVLARAFIMRAKRSFEEERQDLVVRQAGDFFRSMTGGAYQGVNFDLENGSKGGLKAMALPRSGNPLDSENALSRGTREQLYLALRLAYIRQHNKTREKLPVIMDDILVNFDPKRAALAAEVFADFARGNQTLFFTCHPHLAGMLAEAAGNGAARFSIENGLITSAGIKNISFAR